MTIALTPELEQFINERLEEGHYKSATEVIEDALEALAEREERLAIRAMIDEADEQMARGEYTEYDADKMHELADEIIAEGMAELAAERKSGTH